MKRRDYAGRPRPIGPNTPRDRLILLCVDTDMSPAWEIGLFDEISGEWFAGDYKDYERYAGDPDFHIEPTHWAPMPALPPRDRTRLN